LRTRSRPVGRIAAIHVGLRDPLHQYPRPSACADPWRPRV